ncbi:MarR family transcriptional regulator [Streptomyces sp. NBC_00247]|uniref:MarR family winged helix-turn-helix transcriptional regulator n=1 Tax=Streptomyces sp. NBC_00247 TaxID=2975689 RepID=UPI002E2BEC93|nr:helix-turn-helix domain-containing protein [Streptomyces sp. NBC_00247]
MDDARLAEELRLTIGQLVRAVRTADTMPPGEASVLGYLDRGGPMTAADIASRRGVSHQSATKTVKELVGQGYVRAEPHPLDGRKLLLRLTAAGSDRLAQERGRRAEGLGGAIDEVLGPGERETLAAALPLLARLTTHLRDTPRARKPGR